MRCVKLLLKSESVGSSARSHRYLVVLARTGYCPSSDTYWPRAYHRQIGRETGTNLVRFHYLRQARIPARTYSGQFSAVDTLLSQLVLAGPVVEDESAIGPQGPGASAPTPNVVDEIGADQIVMSAHRPSLSDHLTGPNTAHVVHHAKCSVSVVRD